MKEANGYHVNRHSCFLLEYHLVLVTKYRHPVIKGELKEQLYKRLTELIGTAGLETLEINGEADHVHILFYGMPDMNLKNFITNLKTQSSTYIRKHFQEELKPFYWKPYFWSGSYFIAGVSERSEEAVRRYIQNQGRE